ncbi:hypothetical protein [Terracidiphilus gabretensis]|jgi:hypothetical protein|uniref:hypothetical protein n=1 Tax=Terracidiphilus gabretensis TaxID=1577687 RepID=UPI00071BF05A|nr:hypothetical protein [Terracidiphilus gabretensis]
MKTILYEILGALVLYGLVFAAIWILRYSVDPFLLGTGLVADESSVNNQLSNLIDTFQLYASIVLGVSLVCFFLWYLLGSVVIRATAPSSTWIIVWFLFVVVILAAAGVVTFYSQLKMDEITADYQQGYVAGFYFLFGFLLYYLASVFFSPLHARYRIWPARHVRR